MTLEQMQMRRALVQARMEIQKYKFATQVDILRNNSPLFGGRSSLLGRMTGAFSLAEYFVIAVRLGRIIAPLVRRKK